MNKRLLLLVIPTMLLCACSSSSSRTPSVPTVTWSDTGSSNTGSSGSSTSDVVSGSVSVTPPSTSGAQKISEEDAKELAKNMSEYQESALFTLPTEVVNTIKTTGSTDIAVEGYTSLNSTEKCVFSASNYYYRTEASSSSSTTKNWKYIGSNPSGGTSSSEYYIEAKLAGEEGTYTKERVSSTQKITKLAELTATYNDEQLDALTGKTVLSQLDSNEQDESTRVECEYYSKGAGSLIVYGTITVNNYEFTFGETKIKGSIKSAIAYTWENYLIKSGSTDSKFVATVLFKEVKGSMKTTQTVTLSTTSSDRTKPNYSNFIEETDSGYSGGGGYN